MNEEMLREIVSRVVLNMHTEVAAADSSQLGVMGDMNEAVLNAKEAQKELRDIPLEVRETIISKIRTKILENKELLSKMAVEETGMGRVGHKILKHELVAKKTPGTECITTEAWTGDMEIGRAHV